MASHLTIRPNVWIGTSVEDQATADERIPHLLEVPAAVRFLSVEPLLAPVDLSRWLKHAKCVSCSEPLQFDDGSQAICVNPQCESGGDFTASVSYRGPWINWVIIGGESGPNARPCNVEWVRDIVRQCKAAGVKVFVKQDSGRFPGLQGRIPDDLWIQEFPNAS